MLTLAIVTFLEKIIGNLVCFSCFAIAWSSDTLAVPLIVGIVCFDSFLQSGSVVVTISAIRATSLSL
jgi:hypothetical protein